VTELKFIEYKWSQKFLNPKEGHSYFVEQIPSNRKHKRNIVQVLIFS